MREKITKRERDATRWIKNVFGMRKEQYIQKYAFPDQDKMLKIYLKVKSLLKQLNLPFVVVGGTLLGIIRDKKFIDNDLDLTVLGEYDTSENIEKIKELFAKHGFELNSVNSDARLEGKTLLLHCEKDDIDLDISFLYAYKRKRFKCIITNKCNPEVYDEKFFSKPKKILFMDVEFPVPFNPKAFLEATYGKNWQTPISFWNWFRMSTNIVSQYSAYQSDFIDKMWKEQQFIETIERAGKEQPWHGKICLVTEFKPDKKYGWKTALNREDLQHQYNFSVSSVRISPETLKAYPEKHSYWNPLREADFVFVYCSRFHNWEWYMLPVHAKKFMKPTAKMACHFDSDFVWLFHPTWTHWNSSESKIYTGNLSPEQFFEKTGILEVADIYFSVLSNPPFKPYTSKPVVYLPLPTLTEKGYHHGHQGTTNVIFYYSINDAKCRNIALLNHSIKLSSVRHTVENVINKLERKPSIFVFDTNPINEKFYQFKRKNYVLPVGSVFFRRIFNTEEYLDHLHDCYIGIEDTENYIGWSRFVLECALAHVPCIGSSESVKRFFPELYTEHKDYEKQLKLIERLYSDYKFWHKMARKGKRRAIRHLNMETLVKKLLIIAKCINAPEPEEELPRILIGTPFCNEEHSIPLYMKSLLSIDYPKHLIDVVWVENNSTDNTWKMLRKYYPKVKDAGYRSVTLLQMTGKDLSARKKPILSDETDWCKWNKYGSKSTLVNSQHVIGIFNWLQDQTLEKGADYFMMHMADIIVPSDTIHVFLKSFKKVPNAGWMGGVLHCRFPYQRKIKGKDPMHYGLLGPWVKTMEKGKWRHTQKSYDYYVYQPTEEEILKWQKEGRDIVGNCATTGHCWMVPPEIIKKKIHMECHVSEATFVFAEQLWAIGYDMCCNTRLYFKHISLDGIIYRHGYNEKLTREERTYVEKLVNSSDVSDEECLKILAEIAIKYRATILKGFKSLNLVLDELKKKKLKTKSESKLKPSEPKSKNQILFVYLCDFSARAQWDMAWSDKRQLNNNIIFKRVNILPPYSKSDKNWNWVKKADIVFVYISRTSKDDEKWYMLPKLVREYMKPDAKMMVQFDSDFVWLFHPESTWWSDEWKSANSELTPSELFKKTGILDVADIYFTVRLNPRFAKFTSKPVIYMPLPQLERYKYVKEWKINHKAEKIILLSHSAKEADVENTLENVIKVVNKPIYYFAFNYAVGGVKRMLAQKCGLVWIRDHGLSKDSRVCGLVSQRDYMDLIHKEGYIAIDDVENYYGWSRFVLECALAHVPCIGSHPANKVIFPELYVKHNDYRKQIELVNKLYEDKAFHDKMAKLGYERVMKHLDTDYLCRKLVKIAKKIGVKSSFENRRMGFIKFLIDVIHSGYGIPDRPRGRGHSSNGKRLFNQKEWDEYYGKWRKFIENKKLFEECLKEARKLT